MNEADILATTYGDKAAVYRPFKDTLESGESIFKSGYNGSLIYEAVPCALSTHTGGELRQSPSTAAADTSFSLFVRPEVDILPNDFVVVTRLGKQIELIAGEAEHQPSHNNIPVRLAEETV